MADIGGAPKVAQVSPALFGPGGLIGGGERYAFELSRAMASRVNTALFSFGRTPRHERVDGLDIEVLPNWLPFGRFIVDPIGPALIARLRDADIIHYHQTQTLMASAALVYARTARKPIFTTHLGGGGISIQALVDVRRWYAGHLHLSEFSRRALGHEHLPNARVIYGGVDAGRFRPATAPEPAGGAPDVLFVGRLLPHKGLNYLIEAMDRDISLTIVGRRWWRHHDEFFALVERLMAGKRVAIHQDYDDQQLIGAYQRALCVVLPSVYQTVFGERYRIPELLGQTLLEGMACGIPAICTSVGAMPEVVADGVTGFVVPPNDPGALRERIRWLRDHPTDRARMGAAARSRVLDLFTWDRVVDRCLNAYSTMAA